MIQTGPVSNTKKKGCLFGLIRLLLIICTCGLWLMFGKKKSKAKTKVINQKVAICKNCGNQWDV